jgi:hypothetical protein
MSTGGERESSTARFAAAMQAAIDAMRARFADIERDTAERVCHINDSRLGALRLLGEAQAKLRDRTGAAHTALRATERRQREVGRRARHELREVEARIRALQIRLLWRRMCRWVVVALLAGACLWWGFKLWAAITGTIHSLMIEGPPAVQSSPSPRGERAP